MLTGENKEESPNLFTTLSTTTRKFRLQKMELLISDTVGFISKLPAYMIDAFKSTLEELNYTDIVIVVIDVNDTILELKKKFRSCVTTLDEIGVDKDKIIFVLNKSDLVSEEEVNYKADQLGLKDNKKWLPISSVTGQNISKLKDLIQQAIEDRPKLNAKDEVVKQEIEINYED